MCAFMYVCLFVLIPTSSNICMYIQLFMNVILFLMDNIFHEFMHSGMYTMVNCMFETMCLFNNHGNQEYSIVYHWAYIVTVQH